MTTILRNDYVLAVHDVQKSADFYVRVLGFTIVAEPPGWIFVKKDSCLIMLGECPDDMAPSELGCHNYFAYLQVTGADEYHAAIIAAGGRILSPLEDKPWNMREFSVQTVDGHRITIGQPIA